jgi:hypothetical protein
MRLIKTYLLRLYTDTEATERICGDIRPVEEKHTYPFKNTNDFLILLRRLVGESQNASILQGDANSQPVEGVFHDKEPDP